MTNWPFSPASQTLLKQCLDAAEPYDSCNKWSQLFGPKNKDLVVKSNSTIVVNESLDIENISANNIKDNFEDSCTYDEIFENENILSKFGDLQKLSLKNPKILTKLAENLPMNTAEDLFEIIFDHTVKIDEFMNYFFEYYLPAFLKRDNSRFNTDVLLKTYHRYPNHFKILLKYIIKDREISNDVLYNFIITLNEQKVTEIFTYLTCIELTSVEFVNNLLTIYTSYKMCTKTDKVQHFIMNCLKKYCQICTNNKNYGRLFLTYLQNEKQLNHSIDQLILSELLVNHISPFKMPCIRILNEIKE